MEIVTTTKGEPTLVYNTKDCFPYIVPLPEREPGASVTTYIPKATNH